MNNDLLLAKILVALVPRGAKETVGYCNYIRIRFTNVYISECRVCICTFRCMPTHLSELAQNLYVASMVKG